MKQKVNSFTENFVKPWPSSLSHHSVVQSLSRSLVDSSSLRSDSLSRSVVQSFRRPVVPS